MWCSRYFKHCKNSWIWKKLSHRLWCPRSYRSWTRWWMGWLWKILNSFDFKNCKFYLIFRVIQKLNKAEDKFSIFATLKVKKSWHSVIWERSLMPWNTIYQMRPFKKLSPQSQAKESEKSHGNNLTIIWPKRLKERTIVQHDQMKTLFY